MEAQPKYPSFDKVRAAYLNLVSIHFKDKQDAAPIVGKHRTTLEKWRGELQVPWVDALERGKDSPLPAWWPALIHWMRNLRREDLPAIPPPELVQLMLNGAPPPQPAGQPAVQWPSTVTVSLANRPQA